MGKKYFGLKKFGITFAFSLLGVFRYFFRPGFGLRIYNNGLYSEEDEWKEFNDRYHQAIEEIQLDECIDGGKTEQFCRTLHPIAA